MTLLQFCDLHIVRCIRKKKVTGAKRSLLGRWIDGRNVNGIDSEVD